MWFISSEFSIPSVLALNKMNAFTSVLISVHHLLCIFARDSFSTSESVFTEDSKHLNPDRPRRASHS